ncbi:MAG: MBL fold metallo-hydrolase [Gorillibacterium sp.]|nr:MBL fold metallo-hydrolase [Gorillibacterium sp.]
MIYLVITVAIIALVFLVLNFYPALGGKKTQESQRRINESKNFSNGKFINQIPTSMDMKVKDSFKTLREMIKGNSLRKPKGGITTESFDPNFNNTNMVDQITWFGHSALLLKVNGVTLLLDPMFGRSPSPFPLFGPKRYSAKLPIEIKDLPIIDAVIISHDHYDHLDYVSVRKLKGKVKQFIVPLGVAGHLVRWGVDPRIIQEHDWWDEFTYSGLTLASAPARHFSGRGLTGRNTSLWCSWVILSEKTRIFFSGDSGYGPHFKEIGSKYGPFDLTLMECGQYNEQWASIHMMPEQTLQAHLDLQGKLMIPIHWGAFTLALHSWTDPVERVIKAAKQLGAAIATPRIGETVSIGIAVYPDSTWWE